MASASASASATILASLLLIPPPKSHSHSLALPSASPLPLSKIALKKTVSHKSPQLRRLQAAAESAMPSEAPVEATQQIVPAAASDDSVSTIVSALLFIAFIGLSILTIGVIYLAVQDFLQKREREKFEKEAAEKKKKEGGKKRTVRAKTGPRGFGQKIEDDDEVDD